MLNAEQRGLLLAGATVPEHSPGLMAALSGGELFLENGYLHCRQGDWLALVGYALEAGPRPEPLALALERAVERFCPARLALMAPELPEPLPGTVRERVTDRFCVLPLPAGVPAKARRNVARARERLRVEPSRAFTPEHGELSQEFLAQVRPHPRVVELCRRLPDFCAEPGALLLNARDRLGRLAACLVLDTAPARFCTYVMGFRSRSRPCPGASDLLFAVLLELGRDQGKAYLHLGLEVNPGIARFKTKWGGVPGAPYELVELSLRRPSLLAALTGLG